jgi:hypothetical protein
VLRKNSPGAHRRPQITEVNLEHRPPICKDHPRDARNILLCMAGIADCSYSRPDQNGSARVLSDFLHHSA